MKKVFLSLLFILVICLLFGCVNNPNTPPTNTEPNTTTKPLSSDTTFNLESVNGVALVDGKVTLTATQYQEILELTCMTCFCLKNNKVII